MTAAVFVSDVHLRPGEASKLSRFLSWLDRWNGADVFILGDLFDYWIGARHYDRDDFRDALAGLRRSRARLHFVPGNRDFLMDARFTRETGVRLLGPDETRTIDGRRVRMAHGDFIFNTNSKYFLYRRFIGARFVADSLQMLPGAVAVRVATHYKKVSVATTPRVRWTDEALVRAARAHVDDALVCGHIHEPRHLRFDGRELLVLGDWDGGGEFAVCERGEFRLARAIG